MGRKRILFWIVEEVEGGVFEGFFGVRGVWRGWYTRSKSRFLYFLLFMHDTRAFG